MCTCIVIYSDTYCTISVLDLLAEQFKIYAKMKQKKFTPHAAHMFILMQEANRF